MTTDLKYNEDTFIKKITRHAIVLTAALFSQIAIAAQPTPAPSTATMQLFTPDSPNPSNVWSSYFEETNHDVTPNKPLLLALKLFKKEKLDHGYAIDLGAGTGKDTLYLLQHHWHVLAQDYAPKAITIILDRAQQFHLPPPETQVSTFTEMQLPIGVDLINANLALPFTPPKDFPNVWQKIVQHLRIGGRFCGNFFGSKDGYEGNTQMTFVTPSELSLLFSRFKVESLSERHGYYTQANGQLKYWQIFDIVARKTR